MLSSYFEDLLIFNYPDFPDTNRVINNLGENVPTVLQHGANSPEMDLLLTLSVYLMLGCLGLLTSFSIVVCAFRLCLCSPAYR